MSKRKQLVDIDLNGNGIYNGELPYLLRYSRSYEIPEGTEELIISNKDYSFSNQDYLEAIIRDNNGTICEPSIEFLNNNIVIKFTPAFDGGTMKLISDNEGIINASIEPPYDGLCFTALEDNSSVGVAKNLSSPAVMYKSSDGASWENWDYSTINLNKGDKVYLKGEGTTLSTNPSNYYQFSMTGKIAASGDCTSLTNGVISNYCYVYMFLNCTSLVTAPELPATTLVDSCYDGMFYGCTSLVNAPELPATTLGNNCYYQMFNGCTSLVTAPELPATTLVDHCYQSMFYGCTSLATAPELPATTSAGYCYDSMFQGCTSLVNAPGIFPATTLALRCYQSMFKGCTSLTTAPELPATTLAEDCYNQMFSGCTRLVNAPGILPATTLALRCYQSMFYGCTSLATAPELPATTLADNCYEGMLNGCTSLVTAPKLPATTLSYECYRNMFHGCTSLVNAPELPATTLADNCYEGMFWNCTKLISVTMLAVFHNSNRYNYADLMLSNVASSGTFTKNPSANLTAGGGLIPSGWNVVDYAG